MLLSTQQAWSRATHILSRGMVACHTHPFPARAPTKPPPRAFAMSSARRDGRNRQNGTPFTTSRLIEPKNVQLLLKKLGYCVIAAAFMGSSSHGCGRWFAMTYVGTSLRGNCTAIVLRPAVSCVAPGKAARITSAARAAVAVVCLSLLTSGSRSGAAIMVTGARARRGRN